MNPNPASSVAERNAQLLSSAQEHVYKETDDGVELSAWVYLPENAEDTNDKPVILFFFSSLWDQGLRTQFAPQCLHFIERGAVAILVDYRVKSSHQATPLDAMSDARSAIRWARYNAEILGIDENRVVAVGGSAGAHIVLSAALIPGMCDDPNDPNLSCVPNAMALFCPITDTSKKGVGADRFTDLSEANKSSPMKYVRKHLPPSVIFHGTGDRIVPFEQSTRFARLMQRKANICEMVAFEGRDNSFYNFNVDASGYDATLRELDKFLVEQGFLVENPEAEEHFDLD